MIVLDAYAVLALLKDEPAAGDVQQLLAGHEETSLTVLGVAEVLDHLVRLAGAEPDDAALDVAELGLADPPPLEPAIAMRAGFLRAAHYDRRDRAVSLADCVAAKPLALRARHSRRQILTFLTPARPKPLLSFRSQTAAAAPGRPDLRR